MAFLNDIHNPSFLLLPSNNNRTAWRPFGLPIVLVVPHQRDLQNAPIPNSEINDLRIYIRDVPREAKVAGPENTGLRVPDKELYGLTIDIVDLNTRQIIPQNYQALDSNGQKADNLTEGGSFLYTTATRIVDSIPYLANANYYDLSEYLIDLELLTPDRYQLVYEVGFYARVLTNDELREFLCIDLNRTSIARYTFEINHPGDVIHQFYTLTPPPYLTNANKSQDTTISLYRPFTDILQDVFDEQTLLEKVNWVFDAPPETIPYMSAILGWDIPYFPESLDQLRKAVLRRTVELQNIAGSRQALIRLFRLFGFEIVISNLWWSSDGKRYIRPGQKLPPQYESEEITIQSVCQIDLILRDYATEGFASFNIPLLHRPQEVTDIDDFAGLRDGGDLTIEAYRVSTSSDAYTVLKELSESISKDPDNFGENAGCYNDANGFLTSVELSQKLDGLNLRGFSQITISGKLGSVANSLELGLPPISTETISFDRENNVLSLAINGYFDSEDEAIFAFVLYRRQQINVPEAIKDLQSNRFDVQVTLQEGVQTPDPVTLDFAIEFLFRIKAFHSLLNIIKTRISLTETYLVTDLSVGGGVQMRFDTDAGRLQVPPAIIPNIPGIIDDCTLLDPQSLGYKETDIRFRLDILSNLAEEFEAWLRLNGREDEAIADERLALLKRSIIEGCQYTNHGQDKTGDPRSDSRDTQNGPPPTAAQHIIGVTDNPRPSPIESVLSGIFYPSGADSSTNSNSSAYSTFNREFTNPRATDCSAQNAVDFFYKGRVADDLLFRTNAQPSDFITLNACKIGLGSGLYYSYPVRSKIVVPGTGKPSPGSNTDRIRFSGASRNGNSLFPRDETLPSYLEANYYEPLQAENDNWLGQLYRAYGVPEARTLHFSNRNGMPEVDQKANLALQRPELGIQKPIMHFPGCRFPTMNKLKQDFIHGNWDAKPWDQDTGACNTALYLNPRMVQETDGEEYLVFDSQPYSLKANNLDPDIPSLGNHDGVIDPERSIHSVYMTGAEDNPYVDLGQTCEPINPTISTSDPLFNSHSTEPTGGYIDYVDGYPCQSGTFDYDGFDNPILGGELIDALGVPYDEEITGLQLQFKLGTGIRDETQLNLRMDCGCLKIGASIQCSTSQYVDQDGDFDWQPDDLAVYPRVLIEDELGGCSKTLNGQIPSLLEIF